VVAVAYGRESIARLLLQHGADVNAPGGNNETALGWACNRGNEPIVKLLLENGANANTIGPHGSALQTALAGKHDSIAKLLIEHGAKAESP
jgi:ankyrin repeat protein